MLCLDTTETAIELPKKDKSITTQSRRKRRTLKTQVIVDKQTKRIICTAFSHGKRHDFRLFKESKTNIDPKIKAITDIGYQGLQKLHSNSALPKKKNKKNPLIKDEKRRNQDIASERVVNENVTGMF